MDKNKIKFNFKENLNNIGLYSGNFKIQYNVFKNWVGSHLGNRLYIDEISNSRLEIKVKSIKEDNEQWEFFTNENIVNNKLDNYIVNFGNNNYELIINWVAVNDYVVIKLANKLPNNYSKKDQLWISQIISNPIEGNVSIFEDSELEKRVYLQEPNFNPEVFCVTSDDSYNNVVYKSWDDLLGSNADSIDKILSNTISSSFNDISLEDTIDYSKYENFVHFGSAEEQLKNFKFKLRTIELYDNELSWVSSSISGSNEWISQSVHSYNAYLNKKNNIVNTFTGYEKYLYYDSSSAISEDNNSGFGEVYETTWPKSGSFGNYVLYSTTSSEAVEWYEEQLERAIDYDLNNPHNLINTLPTHLLYSVYETSASVSFARDDGDVNQTKKFSSDNSEFLTFVYMIGQYFDTYWNYIKNIKQSNYRDSLIGNNSPSGELLNTILQSLGLNIKNNKDIEDLWDYYNGTDSDGSYMQTGSLSNPIYSITKKDYVQEIQNRLLNTLPLLYKSKGTERSIRALLNCFGVPQTVMKIKEYGGPKIVGANNSADYYSYDHYLRFEGSPATNKILTYTSSAGIPKSIEFVYRPQEDTLTKWFQGDKTGAIITSNWFNLEQIYDLGENSYKLVLSSSNDSIETDFLPLRNGDWWNVLISSGSRGITLSAKQAKYGKIFYESKATTSSAEMITNWNEINSILFGNQNNADVKEYREWTNELSLSDFDEHVRYKKSIYNSDTSSYDSLITRFTFNNPKNHVDVPYVVNSAPNKLLGNATASTIDFSDEVNYGASSQHQWPTTVNIGQNWVNNKIRIESSSFLYDDEHLDYNQKMTSHEFDKESIPDSNKIGIYLSPTDVINDDIIATYAGTNFDNYIGNPDDQYETEYTDLNDLNKNYWKKYSTANSYNDYLRYVNIIDNVLFETIRKFLPARSKEITGVVIEPHVLNRSKARILKKDGFNRFDLTHDIDINIYDDLINTDGVINNIDSEINTTEHINSDALLNNQSVSIEGEWGESNDGILFSMIDGEVSHDYGNYKGSLNDSSTTHDKKDAVIIYLSNPNKLKVKNTDDGNVRLKVH